jgi:glucosamine--fructose-6-phosphate aminotransferase (isomerizing)
MNLSDPKYSQYALVREMMDTIDVVRGFDPAQTAGIAENIKSVKKMLLIGEGSSRIFPAKNAMRKVLTSGLDLHIATER